jgi:hypothetical protein
MKNFTFLLILLLFATAANTQNSHNLQMKIKKMQEDYSRFTRQTEHFSKTGFQITPGNYKNALLKNALAVQKLDSIIYQEYGLENEDWINLWKDEYHYNAEMKNTAWVEKEWNITASAWEDTYKVELELNNDGQVSVMRTYTTNDTSGDFVLESRSEAYYGEDGRLDSVLHYFTEAEGIWEEEGRQIYHYNESGQLVQMDFTSLEEDEGEEYLQTMRFVYTYNDDGQMETSGMYFIDAEMEILFSETVYLYDDSGRLIASEDSTLDFFTFMVELSSRTDYEYNATGDVSVETYSYRDPEAEEWIEEQKDEYTYSNTSFSEVIFPSYLQFWGINEETNTFNYAITEIVTSSNMEGVWSDTDRTLFYYSEGTATSTRDLAKAQVSVYPNPASDNITLKWQGHGILSLEVFHVTGAKVMERQVSSGMNIPVSNLTNGMYIMRLMNDNQTIYSGKLIKR